jgi:uncharacterized membrane protein
MSDVLHHASKLSGLAVIVIGLALRLRTTVVVVAGGLLTGLVAGLPWFTDAGVLRGTPGLTAPGKPGIIDMLGQAFAENRLMTLFILTLPAIGMAERYGLHEQSAHVIRSIRVATVGRLLSVYQLARIVLGAMGLRLNGHALFVRPLIVPMVSGIAPSALASHDDGSDVAERVKAASAAAENYGNFYGQNLSTVQAGVMLVCSVMNGLGYAINAWDLVLYTTPVLGMSVALGAVQFALFDRSLTNQSEVHP